MSELFREVDEMMRQERVEKIWKENGNYIIGFVLAVILITAGFSGYKAWDNHVKIKQTNEILRLMDEADYPNNVLTSESSNVHMRAGARAIDLLTAAKVSLEKGDTHLAESAYESVANDSSAPSDLRELALLMNVRLKAKKEDADIIALLADLNNIWRNPNSPWIYYAYLEAASLQANKNGNYSLAIDYLTKIENTNNLAPSLYEAANSLKHVYSLANSQKDQNKNAK